MAEGSFELKVYSGRGLEVEAAVRMVTVPSAVGELGFLPNHCDYVGLLGAGVVEFQTLEATSSTANRFVVTGGLCTFANNTLKLLADSIDTAESIDRANYAKERDALEAKRSELGELDPEYAVLAQKLSRIEAIDTFLSRGVRN